MKRQILFVMYQYNNGRVRKGHIYNAVFEGIANVEAYAKYHDATILHVEPYEFK